jgi:type IV pilus assembly protein PilA
MKSTLFPMRRRAAHGFTLIELMIVVAIIGILASVAFPVYSDYTIRSKVSDLVIAASNFRTTIAEKAAADGTLGSSGLGLTVSVSGRVSSGTVDATGTVKVEGTSVTIGTAVTVMLRPSLNPNGRVAWACATGNSATFRFVPAECRNT